MAARIHASPPCSSSCNKRAGSPRVMMITMPASEISMPAICRRVTRSRSSSQEQPIMNTGADELSSTALIAVVVRKPWYTMVWNSGTLKSASSTRMPACRRSVSPLPATARRPKGVSTTSAMNQRQKLKLTGSNVSRSARPSTQLPAHSRLVSARRENAATRELEAGSMRLLVGVVRGAHERPDGGVLEAHRRRFLPEQGENGGLDIALDRQVMRRGLQVLADGQHVDIVRAQIAHYREDFGIGLAEADHQAGFGRYARIKALELLQQRERVPIVAARPRLLVEPRHRLQVVVHHVGRRGSEDFQRAIEASAEIRDQYFERGLRAQLAHRSDAVDEVLGAAVAQVVPVHAGDDHIAERELRNGLGEVPRLLGIRGERPAVRHVAERAASRADVAEDHEGRRALAEALGDVRAGGFLAHGVQLLPAQDVLDLVEARAGARGAHADPRRLGQRRGARHDANDLRLALFLYAGFTHARDGG